MPRWRSIAARYPSAARWTRRAAWAYLGLGVAAAIVIWGFGDRTWWGTAVLYSGRWLLLLPLPLVLAAAALLDRRSLPVLAFATAIVLVPVMGLRLGIGALLRGDGAGERLRVASFNAAGNAAAVHDLIVLMREASVDVALLQECPPRLGPLPGWEFHDRRGLCVISRFPVQPLDELDMRDVLPQRQTFGGTSAAIRYAVNVEQRTVTIVNVHLETARRGLRGLFSGDLGRMENNLVLRQIESRRTFAWLGADRADLIVAGDFNMPVESAIYRASWSDLTNAFSRAGRGFGMTRDNGWIRIRIDHILTGSSWQPRRAWVGPAIGSDHRPVFAELQRVGSRG